MGLSLDELEPIVDVQIIHRYLQYTLDLNEEVNCLVKDTDLKFVTKLQESPTARLELHLQPPVEKIGAEEILRLINETPERQINLSFRAQETFFVGRSRFQSISHKRLVCSLLTPLYKLQRRNNQRFKPSSECPCEVEFVAPGISVTPYDVSAGGFSLLSGDSFYERIKTIGVLEIAFSFRGCRYPAKALLQATSRHQSRWKLGFKILDPSPLFEQLLAREAYSYTQRIFARRI